MIFDTPDPTECCLTRSDIANYLRISTKQAGLLMKTMSTIAVGRTHRRVTKADFEAWLTSRRNVVTGGEADRPLKPVRASVAAMRSRRVDREPKQSVRRKAMEIAAKEALASKNSGAKNNGSASW